MSLRTATLSNGLRVITDHIAEMDSIALGVWCDVGTRYEDLAQNGLAHLVEHMMFKGTKHRSAQKIAQEIEAKGGQMNAYTSREHTAYFVHLLKEDTSLAVEIIADMMVHSTFPAEELTKERQVIIQEIGMTHDAPDDLIFDLYHETAYPGQALGAPILGTTSIIENMPHEALSAYTKKFYTTDNLIFSAAGHVNHDELILHLEKAFADLPTGAVPRAPAPKYKGGEIILSKDLEQTHNVRGYNGIARTDADYYAASLLTTILGGGMSSRLFQEVREKRGLVYSVYAHHDSYVDGGQLQIYAGTDPARIDELMPVLDTEIDKIRQDLVSAEELEGAKAQLRAGLLMGRESMLNRANRQAKYYLLFDKTPDMARTLSRIEAVSADDIQNVAEKVFSTPKTLAMLGPSS